jgi:hypothetical protein
MPDAHLDESRTPLGVERPTKIVAMLKASLDESSDNHEAGEAEGKRSPLVAGQPADP